MIEKFRALLLGATLAFGLVAGSPAIAQTTVTFNATGAAQTFVVPAGVTSIQVEAFGARGHVVGSGSKAEGGLASGTLAVVPGETLQINVGVQGTLAANDAFGGGGFNGGGDGYSTSVGDFRSGGGGGASDVRQGGVALADRKIVGGGGGGAVGLPGSVEAGGRGGGAVGASGEGNGNATGGTQTAGGQLGGAFGQGGVAVVPTGNDSSGGGGGGWYGGGAAESAPGGGGSGYIGGVTGGVMVTGVQDGNGVVTLTFAPAAAGIPTMSEWAMIILGLFLACGAALYLQRRQQLA